MRLAALLYHLVAAGASLALAPSDLVAEYVRGGEHEHFGVRLILSADQRWTTVKTSGERDVLQGTWRIEGSRVLLLKDGSADWASAGSLRIVPVDSSFVLVKDYDARKPLEDQHYFKPTSKQ